MTQYDDFGNPVKESKYSKWALNITEPFYGGGLTDVHKDLMYALGLQMPIVGQTMQAVVHARAARELRQQREIIERDTGRTVQFPTLNFTRPYIQNLGAAGNAAVNAYMQAGEYVPKTKVYRWC